MANTLFKGFKLVTSATSEFLADYLYFVRTNEDKQDGYLYFNGKKYGTALDAANELKDIIGTLPEGMDTVVEYINDVYTNLSDAISAETTAREAAISAETAAREAAISAETAAREAADAELETAISDETAAREAADAELETAISAETAERAAADAELETAISDETAERAAADAELETAISAETAARAAADTALSDRIAELETLSGSSHTHDNKGVLDGISSEKVANWDAAEQNAKDYADELVDALDATVSAETSGVTVTIEETNGVLTSVNAELHISEANDNALELKEDGLFAAIYYEDLDA